MSEFNIGDIALVDHQQVSVLAVDRAEHMVKVTWIDDDIEYKDWVKEDRLISLSDYINNFIATPSLATEAKSDPVNSPSHYKFGKSEVIDIVEHLPYSRGNAIKYLARAGRKAIADEIEDLKKAAWYVNREIQRLEKEKADESPVSE